MTAPTTIDEYIADAPEDAREGLESMRQAVRAGAPEAEETIAYAMPAFRSHGGQFLVSFDAYRKHYSLFPASEAVVQGIGQEITPYLAGKGTIQFPKTQPLPTDLIRRIAAIRWRENGDSPRGRR